MFGGGGGGVGGWGRGGVGLGNHSECDNTYHCGFPKVGVVQLVVKLQMEFSFLFTGN